ncbi:MAG: spermidine synthase [Candidatus Eremiobacteraeota bacterium]|nr:spermidine synthase [Candidatus Eremiobacteraeota bacterium]
MPKTENFQWYVEQVAPGELHGHSISQTIVSGRSAFQAYAIVVSPLFGKMLVLDGDTQSAALDEHIYHEALVHPACVAAGGSPRSALILGGGEGASMRELLGVPSMRRVVMVDIDGEVVELCKRHLPEWSAGAFQDPRADTVIGDALRYVMESDEQFDVIIGDLTEPLPDSPSAALHSPQMYAAIRARLSDRGVYALQASMCGPHNHALHTSMIAGLRAAFPHVAPYAAYVPAFDTEWGFALCQLHTDWKPDSEEAAQAATAYAKTNGGLRCYDAQWHRRLFNLPRYLRSA